MSEEAEETFLVPVLPEDVQLEYLAEGAANVVYRLSFPRPRPSSGEPSEVRRHVPAGGDARDDGRTRAPSKNSLEPAANLSTFENRVLRLRKALASTVPNIKSARSFHEIFQALFPAGSLLAQDLVRVSSRTISECNRRLREDEALARRPRQRKGVYLADDEPYGVLVTDMTPGKERGHGRGGLRTVLIEFKSKWLAQSPSAPADAARCRTCALRAQRNAARITEGLKPEVSFCPLDLVSEDKRRVELAIDYILAHHRKRLSSPLHDAAPEKISDLRNQLVDFLFRHPLLLRLRQLQLELDQQGPLHADSKSQEFLIAMTLRDCTVFVKVGSPYPYEQGRPSSIKPIK